MRLLECLPLLAQALPLSPSEIGMVAPLLLTIAGPVLHLYLPHHRMSVEERVKDRKMTETEARRQMRFFQLCAPTVTLLGVALLGLAVLTPSR